MDIDPYRKRERERQLAERLIEEQTAANAGTGEAGEGAGALVKKPGFDAAAEFAKLLGTRTGGAYIPPSRLRAMQRDAEKDKSSAEWQRMTWDALRKSINGLINKVSFPSPLFSDILENADTLSLLARHRSTPPTSNTSSPKCSKKTSSEVEDSSPDRS